MKRIPRWEAIEMLLELEKKELETYTREKLIQLVLNDGEYYLKNRNLAQLDYYLSNETNGEFGVIRVDLDD